MVPLQQQQQQPRPSAAGHVVVAMLCVGALLIIPINTYVAMHVRVSNDGPVYALALLQFVLGTSAGIGGLVLAFRKGSRMVGLAAGSSAVGFLTGLGGPVGAFLYLAATAVGSAGGAWGRPLRIRGRQVHPELREGSDWTRGDAPDASALDAPTRTALEALWLHDAQKEHASVPAFARITWLLCAVGAPGDLVAWSVRATDEEIDHTRRCFALAAGYGARSHTTEAMPDLLLGGLELPAGDPFDVLLHESLTDGCLLEDFNADVAHACALVCQERATRDVLERIAREERSHAEFSWAVVAWLLERRGAAILPALRTGLGSLERVARPTAVSDDKLPLMARADVHAMRAHGRLPDSAWAALWTKRLDATKSRVESLIAALADESERRAA